MFGESLRTINAALMRSREEHPENEMLHALAGEAYGRLSNSLIHFRLLKGTGASSDAILEQLKRVKIDAVSLAAMAVRILEEGDRGFSMLEQTAKQAPRKLNA